VAIILQGRIVAEGPADRLGGADGRTRISFRLPFGISGEELPRELPGDVRVSDGRVERRTEEPLRAVGALVDWARERGVVDLPELEVRHKSLEDVYLELTGEA
jgi:hypothetical protein